MIDYLLSLGVSDVCNGWPGLVPYMATQAAHMVIGCIAVLLPLSARLVGFSLWIGKELLGDIAGCGLSRWVALDSAADIAFAILGFILALAFLRRRQTERES